MKLNKYIITFQQIIIFCQRYFLLFNNRKKKKKMKFVISRIHLLYYIIHINILFGKQIY